MNEESNHCPLPAYQRSIIVSLAFLATRDHYEIGIPLAKFLSGTGPPIM